MLTTGYTNGKDPDGEGCNVNTASHASSTHFTRNELATFVDELAERLLIKQPKLQYLQQPIQQ